MCKEGTAEVATRSIRAPLPRKTIAAAAGSGLTKHGLVAEALAQEIRAQRYRIGEKLPSEPELSLRYGVSRHTIRVALRTLHELGLVNSHQGIGTTVQARESVARYTQAFDTVQDLQQYATTTRVRQIDRTEVAIDPATAMRFGCKPGEHWWRLQTLRQDAAGLKVVAYSEIHIPLAFGSVVDDLADSKEPVFAHIQRRFNESIIEIQQEIACIHSMQANECAWLGLAPNSPGMEITRRFYGRRGRLLEVARSVHPAGAFTYSMRVQLRNADANVTEGFANSPPKRKSRKSG